MIEVAPLDITRMLAVNEQGIHFAPNIIRSRQRC